MKKGIDVSSHQGNVDFQKVSKDGISFVILNAGYGRSASQKSIYFDPNYGKAKAAGLMIGAYWYSYAVSAADAVAEAQACMEAIKGKELDLPVFIDIEEQSQFAKGREFCSAVADAFCAEIIKHGYKAGLYISYSPLMDYINPEVREKYPVWVAQYHTECQYKSAVIWQYTDSGRVDGITGAVDMNSLMDDTIISSKKPVSKSQSNTVQGANSAKAVKKTVKVCAVSGVNLRQSPGMSGRILGAVPNQAVLKVTKETKADKYTWGLTEYKGKAGWVALDFCKEIKAAKALKKGSIVTVRPGALDYDKGRKLADFVYSSRFIVMELAGERAVIGSDGRVTAAVWKKDLTIV